METINILYLTLSVSVALITIFLSVTLIYLMFILRDVSKAIDSAKDGIEKINEYITRPILMTKSIIEFLTPFIIGAEEKFSGKKKSH